MSGNGRIYRISALAVLGKLTLTCLQYNTGQDPLSKCVLIGAN